MQHASHVTRQHPSCNDRNDCPMATVSGSQELQHVVMQELIQDPVVAMDGLTYERSAILELFVERPAGFSYLTKQRLSSKVLLPNNNYRSLVVQLIS